MIYSTEYSEYFIAILGVIYENVKLLCCIPESNMSMNYLKNMEKTLEVVPSPHPTLYL